MPLISPRLHVRCEVAMFLLACCAPARTLAQGEPKHDAAAIAAVPAATTPLAFEVATIKPISPSGMHMVGVNVFPGGKVQIQTASLKSLVCTAFDLSPWQVEGLDAKTDQASYDVEAKPPDALPSTPYDTRHSTFLIEDPRLRQMLQALLVERFRLKFHRETKTGAIYLLERNGKPLPLTPTKAKPSSPYPSGEIAAVGGRGWALHDTSMPELARFLSAYLVHRPVADRTEIVGAFDFKSQLTLLNEQFGDPEFMETLKPVIGEMGLKLVSAQGPVENLVVEDHTPPTAN